MRRRASRLLHNAPLQLALPVAFLLRRKMDSPLNRWFQFATLLASGSGTLLVLLALAGSRGAEADIKTKIAGLDSHILFLRSEPSEWICEPNTLLARVAAFPSVTVIAPYVWADVLLASSPEQSAAVMLKGVLPEREAAATEINRYLSDGTIEALAAPQPGYLPLIVGDDLAAELGVGPGDTLTLTHPTGRSMDPVPRAEILATFNTTTRHDRELAYTTLAWVDRLNGRPAGCFRGIAVRTENPLTSHYAAAGLSKMLGDDYTVTDWSEQARTFKSVIDLLLSWILIVDLGILLLAAMFSLSVVLLVMHDRRRDLAVLIAMGMPPRALLVAIGTVGTLVTLVGVVVGGVLAVVLCPLFTAYRVFRVPEDQIMISHISFELTAGHVLATAAVQIVLPTLVGLIGARTLLRRPPAGVLRDE